MLRFAVTIFLSAFLLFQVQPILGKYILPWFGGGASIWTTCMLFFQIGLLGGYLYAHLLGTFVRRAAQGWVHLALLAGSLALLPNPLAWKPEPGGEPISGILILLLVNIGGPFLLLSATGPLLQSWFSRTYPGRSPYRLYALSNAASLLALLSYPFVVEPTLRLAQQVDIWIWGDVAFVACCGWCAVRFSMSRDGDGPAEDAAAGPSETDIVAKYLATASPSAPRFGADVPREPQPAAVGPLTVLLWLGLAACGSAMLLATTNQLCQEVAVVPFLWIVPLVLYLLTFIICFDNPRWYGRTAFGVFLLFMLPWACVVLFVGVSAPLIVQILVYAITLFACCMTCHGELARVKPHPQHLTLFYLMIALGGAWGGVLVGLIAPLAFWGFWEYHLALAGCCLLTLIAWYRDDFKLFGSVLPKGLVWSGLLIGFLALEVTLGVHIYRANRNTLYMTRNFYGALQIKQTTDDSTPGRPVLELVHGRISHGFQYLSDERRHLPTSYYAEGTGAGIAIHTLRRLRESGLRIGVIGLGTGTLAAHGREGDFVRFYEINPSVEGLSVGERVAFFYLRGSAAQVDVRLGDARIRMEKELREEGPQQYDVLAVDAFSSDAIPIHLLTKECAEVYWRHLKPDGVLALHVSNRFLNLDPICRALAEQRPGCQALRVNSSGDDEGANSASWVLLTSNQRFMQAGEVLEAVTPWEEDDPAPLLWTDDFHSLWQVLQWH